MSLVICGIGTSAPPTAINQEEAEHLARVLCCRSPEDLTWLSSMYRNTGIRQRHQVLGRGVVQDVLAGTRESGSIFLPRDLEDDPGPTTEERMELYDQEALPLAVEATERALHQARMDAKEITHLVTVSCTGFSAPGVDIRLIEKIGLPRWTQRTMVGFMGCHGALNGLRVARALAESDCEARVLLCAVELCSLHYSYGWNPQRIIGNALFADGAAAVVGVGGDATSEDKWQVTGSGSYLMEKSARAMSWRISDHGFVMTLSRQVPDLIRLHIRPWMERWLAGYGLTVEGIGSWAIHPGGPKILEAVEESLGLSQSQTATAREVFAAHGNMSSPTVLFILSQLRAENAALPCVALGFGPGLTIEAALLRQGGVLEGKALTPDEGLR